MADDPQPIKSAMDAVPRLVEILKDLPATELQRAISASLVLLGQPISQNLGQPFQGGSPEGKGTQIADVAVGGNAWMIKYNLTKAQIEHVFAIDADGIEVIAARLPGSSNRKQTLESYLLAGVRSLLATGETGFTDQEGRDVCEKVGCFNAPNHSNYTKGFGNLIRGSKAGGWKLTNPGLEKAAEIIAALASSSTKNN